METRSAKAATHPHTPLDASFIPTGTFSCFVYRNKSLSGSYHGIDPGRQTPKYDTASLCESQDDFPKTARGAEAPLAVSPGCRGPDAMRTRFMSRRRSRSAFGVVVFNIDPTIRVDDPEPITPPAPAIKLLLSYAGVSVPLIGAGVASAVIRGIVITRPSRYRQWLATRAPRLCSIVVGPPTQSEMVPGSPRGRPIDQGEIAETIRSPK